MQKRFCTCGFQVFVDYTSRKGQWNPLLIIRDCKAVQGKKKLICCPNCGTPLTIHVLR